MQALVPCGRRSVARPGPVLPLAMVSAGPAWRWHHRWLRELRFLLCCSAAEHRALRCLRLQGLVPQDLYELRTGRVGEPDFWLASYQDNCGRVVTVGEMLEAMFGLADQPGLRVPAAELRQVPADGQTCMEVLVMVSTRTHVENVQLLADLHDGDADV